MKEGDNRLITPITIEEITRELHKAFLIFNDYYFQGELPPTAITIQSSSHKRNAMGWCTTRPVWGDRKGKIQMYEINISAEYIDLDFFETMDTLLHEMIHLYHKVKNIQDTSRNNTYHNKNFKNKAIELGFEYASNKPDPRHGWTYARLGKKAIEQIAKFEIDRSKFIIARKGSVYFKQIQELAQQQADLAEELATEINYDEVEVVAGRETTDILERKPSSYKWQCPSCNVSVRSTKKEVNIICGECEEDFQKIR